MSKTKILVFKKKQLIFGGIIIVAVILIFVLIGTGLKSGSKEPNTAEPTPLADLYIPGVYTSVIALNDTYLNLEVVVDAAHINSVRIVNIDEAVTTMYPLVERAVASICEQLCSDVAIESVTFSEDSKYTQALLLSAVSETLKKAQININ